MVDGVNFNPFTGKVFTTEEVQKLDTDADGKVSSEELLAGASWLSGEQDAEGDVQIGSEGSKTETPTLSGNAEKTYNLAAQNGVKDTAEDSTQLQEYMNTLIDSYIEQYIQQNPGMENNEKSSLITFIKSQGQEFVNQYIKENTTVPYDTKSVASDLISKLDAAVAERKATATEVNDEIENYKNNVDANYEKLAQATDKADDDFVTSNEFKQMKEEAVAYIMGMLLNGNEDSEFLSGLNANYKNSSGYKVAMAAIKAIEGESDPAKIKEYLEQAKAGIEQLIGDQNVDGTSKLNDSVNTRTEKLEEAKKAEEKAKYTETLSNLIDEMVESYSNETETKRRFFGSRTVNAHSAEDVQTYQARLTNIMNKFLETYEGDGTNIESEFKNYMTKVMQESDQALADLAEMGATDSSDKYGELKTAVNNVGTYVSNEEKQAIIDISTDFVMNQLAQGIADISILADIYPDYAKDEKFTEAQTLIAGLETSATPKEDLAKAKQLISEMMTGIGADKISDGVKNHKMPAVTLSDVDRDALTSSVPGYDNNESISTGRYRDRNDALNDIQNQARAKLESMRSALLAQLKSQMGADYDEAALNEMIDDAIYQTINDFTDMRVDKNGKHYTTNDAGFVTSKSGRKSRGVVNVKQLVDAFLAKFQELSANAAGEPDLSKNPVSTEEVMADTPLADAYQDKSTVIFSRDKAAASQQAKNHINIIAAQLKTKLRSKLGSDYNSAQINEFISQATLATLDSMQETRIAFFLKGYKVNARELADKFIAEFNKLYEEANKDKAPAEETTKS